MQSILHATAQSHWSRSADSVHGSKQSCELLNRCTDYNNTLSGLFCKVKLFFVRLFLSGQYFCQLKQNSQGAAMELDCNEWQCCLPSCVFSFMTDDMSGSFSAARYAINGSYAVS